MVKKWHAWPCHDCGVRDGELHKDGCDMERCPICGKQLISCGCLDKVGGYDKLPFRVPYILIPNKCGLCGEQWPTMFEVPGEEWKKYVTPPLQDKQLCRECYEELNKMFPNGWQMLSLNDAKVGEPRVGRN